MQEHKTCDGMIRRELLKVGALSRRSYPTHYLALAGNGKIVRTGDRQYSLNFRAVITSGYF